MANHNSAKKAYRQTIKKTAVNRSRVSEIRTCIKKVLLAVESGIREEAVRALSIAQSKMMQGVTKGVLKLNTASRKISRLSAKIKTRFVA